MRRVFWLPLVGAMVALVALVPGCSGCGVETPSQSEFFSPRDFGTWAFDGKPALRVVRRVDFGDVPRGEARQQLLVLENTGRLALEVTGLQVEGPFGLGLAGASGVAVPVRLSPRQTLTLVVTYEALDTAPVRGELRIESNDPESPQLVVDLLANVALPCLEVRPETLDFGLVGRNARHSQSVELVNCSPNAITRVEPLALEGAPEFSLASGGNPEALPGVRELMPGESVQVNVGFETQVPGPYQGVLVVRSDDEFAPERRVAISAEATPYACPQAVIVATPPGRGPVTARPSGNLQALPLDRVSLDASRSVDPEGVPIERVEWSIIERPEDTVTSLQPDGESAQTELYLELSGRYVVELHVYNARGTRSCEPARLAVEAVSNEDIHLQLVWDTPADPDRLDNTGSDLDIHLLHPQGSWNRAPYDCFWQNMIPDWGVTGEPSDDPSLDIDTVTGWGPENINLNNPESGRTYEVGVHHYTDHGFGVSYATVRVYIGGALVWEERRRRLRSQEFWHVARIAWPTAAVTPVGTVRSGFP